MIYLVTSESITILGSFVCSVSEKLCSKYGRTVAEEMGKEQN
jgi:hypothetical protein